MSYISYLRELCTRVHKVCWYCRRAKERWLYLQPSTWPSTSLSFTSSKIHPYGLREPACNPQPVNLGRRFVLSASDAAAFASAIVLDSSWSNGGRAHCSFSAAPPVRSLNASTVSLGVICVELDSAVRYRQIIPTYMTKETLSPSTSFLSIFVQNFRTSGNEFLPSTRIVHSPSRPIPNQSESVEPQQYIRDTSDEKLDRTESIEISTSWQSGILLLSPVHEVLVTAVSLRESLLQQKSP